MQKIMIRIAAIGSLLLLSAAGAKAQISYVWDGGDPANGTWSAATNWTGDVAPPNPTTNYLAFAGVTRLSNTANVPWTALGIVISNNAGSFILNGSDLTLTASSPNQNAPQVFEHKGLSNVVINNSIVIQASTNARRQFLLNSSANATFNGMITNTGTGLADIWMRGNAGGGGPATAIGTINGKIDLGTNKLSKLDTVTWVIATNGNVWGRTELYHTGVLRIAAANALPTNTLVVFDGANPGGRLDLNNFNQTVLGLTGTGGVVRTGAAAGSVLTINDQGATNVYAGFFTDNGSLVKMGPGRTILTATNGTTITGNVVVADGVLQAGTAAGTQYYNTLGGNVGNRAIYVNNGARLEFNSRDTLQGAIPMFISGAVSNNGYQLLGPTTLSGGTIYGGVGNASLLFQNYTLLNDITVTGTVASAIVGSLSAYPGFHLSKAGGVIFNVQDVTGDPNADLTVSAQLINQYNTGLPGSLIKTGPGTMQLSGNNLFSGNAIVSNGTLALTASGSMSNATVTIGANGKFDVSAIVPYTPPAGMTIQGNGTVVGGVTMADDSKVYPGTYGNAGTLTFANDLLWSPSGNGTNYFDLTNNVTIGSGINDLLVVNGDFEPINNSITINARAPLISGTYRLINYGTSSSMSFGPLLGATSRDTWTLDTSIATQVNLIVSSGTNQSLVWCPQANADWDIKTTMNWTNPAAGTLDVYADADTVLFDDSGAWSNILNLATALKPAAITVNSSSNYTFAGAGKIRDGFGNLSPITKNGSGTLTLATTNDFSGTIAINNGAVVLATSASAGAGAISIAAGATLEDSAGSTFTNSVSGAGQIVKSGTGTMTLTYTNSFNGPIMISNATVAVNAPGWIGGGNFAASILDNGLLSFSNSTQVISGAISGTGALTHASGLNSGSLTLINTNSYTGLTTVYGGAMTLASPNGPAIAGSVMGDNNNSPDIYTTVNNQFGPGSVMYFTNNTGDHFRFELIGTTQTLAGIHTFYAAQKGVIQNREVGPATTTNCMLILNGSGNYFYSGYLRDQTAQLALTKIGTGTQTFWGTVIDFTGPAIIGAGSLVLTNVDDSLTSSITISNGANIVVDTSARNFQLNRKTTVSGGGSLIKIATNNLMMIGANNYGITMAMSPGALIDVRAGVLRNEYGQFNDWTNNKASLSISNGASFFVWDANTFVDALNGEGLIDKGQNSTHTLTIGTADGSGTFNGLIRSTTGILNLVKSGAGTQVLGGNNSYSGTTFITGGTLDLGASGSITGTTRIVLSTGTVFKVPTVGKYALAGFQSLEGSGIVTGDIVQAAANCRIVPGIAGIAGTLTLANGLSLSGSTTNYFDLGGGAANDLLSVDGNLEPSNAVIAINSIGMLTNGTYTVASYSGAKTTSFNATPVLSAGGLTNIPAGRKTFAIDETVANQINVIVGGTNLALKWISTASANWDLASTNWLDLDGLTNTVFFQQDSVLFDDTPGVATNVSLVGSLAPGAVTIDASTNLFTIGGSGMIGGYASVTKNGTNLAVLISTNTYSGVTTINNGTLQIGNGTVNGAFAGGIYNIASPGTLRMVSLNANTTKPIWSNIVGSGTLALNTLGTGTGSGDWGLLALSNAFAGTLKVETGRVYTTAIGNWGLGGVTNIVIPNGGHFAMFNILNGTVSQPLTIAGAGYGEAGFESAVRLSNAGYTNTISGPVTLSASATIGAAGGGIVSGVISGSSNSLLTIGSGSQAGTVILSATNTYTGGTRFNAGTAVAPLISESGPSSIGNTGDLIFGGGQLRYDGAASIVITRTITNVGLSQTSLNITNAATTVFIPGMLSGTGGLIKAGAGTLVISNHAVIVAQGNPGIAVQGGLLLVADAQINSQLPSNNEDDIGRFAGDVATMTLAGSSSYNRSNQVLYVGNSTGAKGTFNIQDNASFWGNYRISIAQNAGATGTVNMSGASLALGNDLYVGNGGVGTFNHTGGTYTNFGGYTYVGLNAGATGRFYQISGPAFVNGNLVIGNNANAVGAFYHVGGDLYVNGELGPAWGNGSFGSYGFYQMTGGTVSNGNWVQVGRSGLGVLYMLGGSETHRAPANGILAGNNVNGNSTGVMYFANCQLDDAGRLCVGWSGTARAEVTIDSGTSFTVGQNGVQFNQAGTTFAVLNLNGGTLITSNVYKNVAGGYSVVNFNGGTLRARNSQILLGAGAGGVGAVDAAFVYAGGAIVDSTNLAVSITQPLRAPSGNGVSALPAIGTLPGYSGAPYVSISGGGGTGATAIAQFDYTSGTVTGLVLTSPGTDYNSQPTVTLVGGGMPTNLLGLATIGTNISGGLTKLGSGTLLLNASNTLSGASAVNGGYLYGTGTVNSAVTVNNGGAIGPSYLTPVTGTFTIASSLTISNGGTLSAYMRGTNPTIRVTGDFNIAPTTMVQLISLTPVTNGTYVLVDYNGTFNGSISDFLLAPIPYGSQGYLTNNLANTSIDLVVTNAGGTGLKWNGLVDATWKHYGPLNWKTIPGNNPAAYSTLDVVTFDDTAAANFTVDLTEPVAPASITVSNSANDYVFTGVGSINGGCALTKTGPGTLTIAQANGFLGGTIISNGTVKLANVSALGAPAQSVTLAGGKLQLASDTPVNAYSLSLRSGGTVLSDRGTPGGAITNYLNSVFAPTNASLSVTNGPNTTSGISAVTVIGRLDVTNGIAAIDVGSSSLLTLNGTMSSAPQSLGTFIKNGAGTLNIASNNSYWDFGNYYFNNGTTIVRNWNSLGDNTPVPLLVLGTNAVFQYACDTNLNSHGNITINGDSSIILDRGTVGSGFVHTNATLLFTNSATLSVMPGANVTGGLAGIVFQNMTLGATSTVNVVTPTNVISADVTVTGLITQIGTGRSLIKNGNGSLTLRPTNPSTYSGGTVVNGGTLLLGFANGTSNFGTIAGTLLINTGAVVRTTIDKALGFANAASGNVTTITMNSALLEIANATGGHGGGQTVYMTASEIRSNGGTNGTNSACFRFANQGPDPAIYSLASSATSVISGRVGCDITGKFGAQDGAADIDLLVTALITDGIGSGSPANGIIKTNAGTMALTSSNNYSGITKVDGGRLLVNNGSGSGTGTNQVDVAAGCTLGGTGTVAGTVVSYGSVAPGMSAGLFTIGGDCIAIGSIDIEIGGPVAGASYDRLVVSNTAAISAGTLNVSLINGYMPSTGSTFTIITSGSLAGPFGSVNPLPALTPPTLGWEVIYTNNAVVLSVTSAPPPPSGYDAWAAGVTNGLTNATDVAYGDGYANLLKYATGSSATNSDNVAAMLSTRTNGTFALRFSHNTNATDITLIIEGAYNTENNAAWNGIATNINGFWGATTNYIEDTSSSPAAVTVWDTDATATNRFLRLRVTRP